MSANQTWRFLIYRYISQNLEGAVRPSLDPPLVRLMVLCRIFSSCNVEL